VLKAKKNKTTPSASTLGVVKITPHASMLHKLGRNRTDGSNLLGVNAGTAVSLPCLWQKNKSTMSSTTQDVVEVALHASPSNKLDINQSNGLILLGRMRLLSRATIQGHGGSRFVEDLNRAEGSVRT
jgi:hypothetical protein